MPKNIAVVDENGNEYEATYPKRAKGLVKKGRARFIDESTICLACPPDNISEDSTMPKEKNTYEDANAADISVTANDIIIDENVSASDLAESAEWETKTETAEDNITVREILKRIDDISTDGAFLTSAISELANVKISGPGDIGAQEKARAFGEMVKAREETNRRLIDFYEKIYQDVKPKTKKSDNDNKLLWKLLTEIGNPDVKSEGLEKLTEIFYRLC